MFGYTIIFYGYMMILSGLIKPTIDTTGMVKPVAGLSLTPARVVASSSVRRARA